MKFSIGDKIVLKQTDEEGKVTDILSKDMFEVEVGGTRFPVHKDDIDHPYLKWFTAKKTTAVKNNTTKLPIEILKSKPPKLSKGIYLSFLPVYKQEDSEEVVDYFKLFLLNETPYDIVLKYEVRVLEKQVFAHQGQLHAFADLYLHPISFNEMCDIPRFHWALAAANKSLKPEQGIFKMKPQKLFQNLQTLEQKNEATFSHLLLADFSKL